MIIESEELKSEIAKLKKLSNTDWDYDVGYANALSTVEGLIAVQEKYYTNVKELIDDGCVTKWRQLMSSCKSCSKLQERFPAIF